MRGMVRVAAPVLAAAVVLVAGCGTTHYRPAAGERGVGAGDRSLPDLQQAGPATITRADAERLARTLLARAAVPRGAQVLTGRAPAVVRQVTEWTAGNPSIGLHRIWTVSQPISTVYALVSGHVPTGMEPTGNGQNGYPARDRLEFASYSLSRMPTGVDQASLTLTVAPSGADTLLRADVQVIWYPPRSAAEHVPAGTHAVTVTVSHFGSAAPLTVSKTFTSAALIGRLAAMLNGVYASPGGDINCPLETVTYKLAFAASRTAAPYLVAAQSSCAFVSITVDGHQQPALQPPTALGPALSTLMGRPSALPRSARIPPGH